MNVLFHVADGYAKGLCAVVCLKQPAWEQVTAAMQQLLGSFDRPSQWPGTKPHIYEAY